MALRLVRAVLLDVDGTLYHQGALRFLMALELSTLPLVKRSGQSAATVWRSLHSFRRVREELRSLGSPEAALVELQYSETAKRLGVNPTEVEQIVTEWIYRRALKYLGLCQRYGLRRFCAFLKSAGIQIGVFSDYPVYDKLRVLGLSDDMTLSLCATDHDINALKPHPNGFLRACTIWGFPPQEVLYVGDRPEVDAVGAAAVGMPCAMLVRKTGARGRRGSLAGNFLPFSSFLRLQHAFTTYHEACSGDLAICPDRPYRPLV